MKKSIVALMLFVLIPLAAQAAPLSANKLSWRVEYYANSSLAGTPALTLVEANISHDWGYSSPGPEIPVDNFSGRWTGTRYFEAGTYLFLLSVDDGARVWFDGRLLLDAWDVGHQENIQTEMYINTPGDHEIQVAYFESSGTAKVQFEAVQRGGKNELANAWRGEYFTNPTLSGQAALVRQDATIDFNWDAGSPDPLITRDNFSVRWTRPIWLPKDTVFNLQIQHDDGLRVYADDKIIYDSWYDQVVSYTARRVTLCAGERILRVEYYDHVSNATARMTMAEDSQISADYKTTPGEVGVVVDNNSPRFSWNGSISGRYIGGNGYNNDFFWIYNNNTPGIFGKWSSPVNSGNYEVYAFIPAQNATTTAAHYRIFHYGEWMDRTINQNIYHNEWVSLGRFYFGGQPDESVLLYGDTAESLGSSRLAFDALKFVQ